MADRRQLLTALLRLDRPIGELRKSIESVEDDPDDPVLLTVEHFRVLLSRFERGQISARDLEQWAELIDSRSDVDYQPDQHDDIAQLIFMLANPMLHGDLRRDAVPRLLESIPG